MQTEKEKFEATVGAMSKQLMDFVEKMNKLEVEAVSSSWSIPVQCQLNLEKLILSWDLYNFIIDEVQERLFISGTAFEV